MVPCSNDFIVMVNRSNDSTVVYAYTVQARDGCLEVVVEGTFDDDGMLLIGFFIAYLSTSPLYLIGKHL